MIISLPAVVNFSVIPQLKPTVPSAETVSNIISSIENPLSRSVIDKAKETDKNTAAKSSVTVIALPTTANWIERPNASTSLRFRNVA